MPRVATHPGWCGARAARAGAARAAALPPAPRPRRRNALAAAATAAAAPAPPATSTAKAGGQSAPATPLPPPPTQSSLPPALRNVAVRLADVPNPASPGGSAAAYVLGMSHVSQVSVDQIRECIAAIAPDVLLLELCRDRVGLLLPPDRGPAVWHAPRVELVGVPTGPGWPSPASLLAACRAAPGVPVTTHDIEADCVALQATGLFARVRPKTTLPPSGAAPQFLRRRAGDAPGPPASLQPAAPLGRIRYTATPRELPPLVSLSVRLDSALAEAGWSLAGGKAAGSVCAAAVEDAAGRSAAGAAGATVGALLAALPKLRGLARPPAGAGAGAGAGAATAAAADVSVSYAGLESGAVEAVLRPAASAAAAAAADPAVLKPWGAGAPETGLEASADGGEGPGIEPFVPYRGPLPLTATMRVDNLAAVLDVDLDPIDAVVDAGGGGEGGGPPAAGGFNGRWPPPAAWAAAEAQAAGAATPPSDDSGGGGGGDTGEDAVDDLPDTPDGEEDEVDGDPHALPDPPQIVAATAQLLTAEYARRQAAAGAKVGVVEGAAWRAALAAADAGGVATQVVLGDVPARLTAARLAKGVLGAAPVAAAVAVGGVAAAVWAGSAHVAPPGSEPALAAAAAAALAAAAWPFISPLLEIGALSKKEAAEIEAAVAPPGALAGRTAPLKLWGEDAIIGWPGAAKPVIDDRDAFMAASLWAAAAGTGGGPAYVADAVDDGCGGGPRRVWRYAGLDGGGPPPPWPARASPRRAGEGSYTPTPGPRAVVAIVGSAHVPGMQRAWADFSARGGTRAAVDAAAAVLNQD